MYIQRNIEVLSLNHFFSGQPISITYSECVTVALIIQHANSIRNISLSSVACVGCTMLFPHYLTYGTIFVKSFYS